MRITALVMLVGSLAFVAPAFAQDGTYMAHPGGAISGSDTYGNSYSGVMDPGGYTASVQDQYGRTHSGVVDPNGQFNYGR